MNERLVVIICFCIVGIILAFILVGILTYRRGYDSGYTNGFKDGRRTRKRNRKTTKTNNYFEAETVRVLSPRSERNKQFKDKTYGIDLSNY